MLQLEKNVVARIRVVGMTEAHFFLRGLLDRSQPYIDLALVSLLLCTLQGIILSWQK